MGPASKASTPPGRTITNAHEAAAAGLLARLNRTSTVTPPPLSSTNGTTPAIKDRLLRPPMAYAGAGDRRRGGGRRLSAAT